MGNGRLAIGVGEGEATVFNSQPAIQQFGNILAQRKAEQDKKDQMLINQMSQLKPDQLRQGDKEDYLNKYNDWKNTQINANNLPRNSKNRLDALASAQQKYSDLGTFISQSKQEAQGEHQLAQTRLLHPHLFADDVDPRLTRSMASPMSSPDFIPANSYPTLERYVDHEKVNSAFDKAYDAGLKQQSWGNPMQSQGKDKQGNKTGVVVHNERAIDPSQVLNIAAHIYDLDPNTKVSIDKRYADIQGQNPGETKMLRLRQNAIDRGDLILKPDGTLANGERTVEKSKPEFKANYKPDNYYAHFDYRMANKEQTPPSEPTAMNIHFGEGGKGVVHAPNYVALSLPNKNFAGANGINLETGKPESALNSSDSYSIVGAGDFPIVKGKGYGGGTIAQPDWAASHPSMVEYKRMVHVRQNPEFQGGEASNHLIPYENLPKNVANQKDVSKALSGLNKTPVYSTSEQQTPKGKSQPLNSVQKESKASEMIRVKLPNGNVGQIPASKLHDFQRDYPGAQKID